LRRASSILALAVLAITAHAQDITVKIIAFNDFHGNLQSPGKFRSGPNSPDVPAGGADYLAGYVALLKSENPLHVVVSSGDLTGAAPLVSTLFHDEGTIEVMNRLGLEINAVGNHGFDHGNTELQRKAHGGCVPNDANSCKGPSVGTPIPFEGAKFQYLAANVYDASNKTIFPPYVIKTYAGLKIAFIGLTLKETPTIVVPDSIKGLRFTDEATEINALVHKLRPQHIAAFIVLVHQGDLQAVKGPRDINACVGGLQGSSIRGIVSKLDNAVDLVLSAHSHEAYVCSLPNSAGRSIPVTSANAFGRVLTDIDLTVNKRTRRVTHIATHNILIDRTNPEIKPDLAIQHIVERYAALAAPIVNRVVGSISAEIPRTVGPSGENAMGDLIADAQLEFTSPPAKGGAVVAFANEGGIRAGLPYESHAPGVLAGKVTYGELFTAQPFQNNLITMTLTGDQIRILLEEQFKGCALGSPTPEKDIPMDDRALEVSEGFSYTWDKNAPACSKVDPASIRINNAPVDPAAGYRVTVNSLLADGGAQFYILKQGTQRLVGPVDLDAMVAYLAKHPAVSPVAPHRITLKP
jgi:5'-nucleotidase